MKYCVYCGTPLQDYETICKTCKGVQPGGSPNTMNNSQSGGMTGFQSAGDLGGSTINSIPTNLSGDFGTSKGYNEPAPSAAPTPAPFGDEDATTVLTADGMFGAGPAAVPIDEDSTTVLTSLDLNPEGGIPAGNLNGVEPLSRDNKGSHSYSVNSFTGSQINPSENSGARPMNVNMPQMNGMPQPGVNMPQMNGMPQPGVNMPQMNGMPQPGMNQMNMNQPQGTKSKKGIIIAVIAAVLVLGIGIGAFFITRSKNAEEDEAAEIYSSKSAKSADITAAGTIKTAVDSALASERAYDEVQELARYSDSSAGEKVVEVRDGEISAYGRYFSDEVKSNLSTVPKVKYTKEGAESFCVYVNNKGQITVCIESDNAKWTIQPTICADYQ